jgi:hypothetical protein
LPLCRCTPALCRVCILVFAASGGLAALVRASARLMQRVNILWRFNKTMENSPDTSAGSMITLHPKKAGKLNQLSARVAAVRSSTGIEHASYVSNDVVETLMCMLVGLASLTASEDVVWMGMGWAEDLCAQHGLCESVYKPMIAAFRQNAGSVRVFPEGF